MVRTITTDPERARRYRENGYWDGGTAFRHLEAVAAARPDSLAIVDRAGELSYGGLLDEVERASAGLAAHGVGIGDVVSWQLPNRREGTILHLAAVRMGAISNPIVPIYLASAAVARSGDVNLRGDVRIRPVGGRGVRLLVLRG